MTTSQTHESATVERFMGFADAYDTFRPRPPLPLLDILTQLAQTPRPSLVVDLGSGTGLSTALWASRAAEVVGVEPSADMRRQAEARTDGANVRYLAGYANATGLSDGCADIVTCSQSLHWMEPVSTLAEIARILRPGGVFAAYDYDWPPTLSWGTEQAHQAFAAQIHLAEQAHGFSNEVRFWDKHQHLKRMRASGLFCVPPPGSSERCRARHCGRFVDLRLQHRLHVPRLDTDHW
jgi:ubiquinone/menaquinone biosynthesis C-methylase UbiE